jgi:hypothetical protein
MEFGEFVATLAAEAPPEGVVGLLRALWLDAKGDFAGAHGIAQDVDTRDGARVHAYLHRKEGDLPNARYWYKRANAYADRGSLSVEWEALVRRVLARLAVSGAPASGAPVSGAPLS